MSLLEIVRTAFTAEHGGPATRQWRVPGRIEVIGKHTDYAGGRSVVGALSRGLTVLAARRNDDRLRVVDAKELRGTPGTPGRPGTPGTRGTPGTPGTSGGPGTSTTASRSHLDVVVDRLTRNFPGARRGATIVFASDLPRAAGMSSSSALVTGLAVSLAAMWDLESRDEWRANIATDVDVANYCASIENGQSFGTLAGDDGVGTFGGSEDHAAIVLGKAGHLSAFSFVPLRHLADVRLPDAWQFVVATSGVVASKSGAARDRYNHLSLAAAALLDLWNQSHPPCASLAAALATGPAAGDELRLAIRQHTPAGWMADTLERRLAHFEIEDALAAEAVQAIQCGDALAIGAVGDASQHRAELLLGNQVSETIALAHLARVNGAFAASSFGAGFGGSVWALVERERAPAFAERWLASYRREFPAAAARAEVFVTELSVGVTS